jgi:hypothetical protein
MLTHVERRRGWFLGVVFLAMVSLLAFGHHGGLDSVYQCPFRGLTGYSCFGCGMTRATRLALFGDWAASVMYHPMGVPFLIGFAGVSGHGFLQSLLNRRLEGAGVLWLRRQQRAIWLGTLIFVVVFGLVRFGLEVAGILTPV